jgi:hypothetical protein
VTLFSAIRRFLAHLVSANVEGSLQVFAPVVLHKSYYFAENAGVFMRLEIYHTLMRKMLSKSAVVTNKQ